MSKFYLALESIYNKRFLTHEALSSGFLGVQSFRPNPPAAAPWAAGHWGWVPQPLWYQGGINPDCSEISL